MSSTAQKGLFTDPSPTELPAVLSNACRSWAVKEHQKYTNDGAIHKQVLAITEKAEGQWNHVQDVHARVSHQTTSD